MQSLNSLLIRLRFVAAQGRLTDPSLEDMVNVSTEDCSPESRSQLVYEIMKAMREFTSVLGEYEGKTMTEEQLREEVKRIDNRLTNYLWSWFLAGEFRPRQQQPQMPQSQSDAALDAALAERKPHRKVVRRVRKVKAPRSPRSPPPSAARENEWFPPAFSCGGGGGCSGRSCDVIARGVLRSGGARA